MKLIKYKNAVLVNELRMLSKNRKSSVQIFVLNLLLVLASLLFIAIINESFYSGSSTSPQIFIYFFLVVTFIEGVMVCFIVPTVTSGTISGERERQTLDVLLMTDMTPWEITVGKYLASVMHVLFIMVSTLPIMALVFLYGNIPLWTLFLIFFTLVTTVLFLASFGVFFSASLKKTSVAGVLSYLVMFFAVIGSIGISFVGYGIIYLINDYIYYKSNVGYGPVASSQTIEPAIAFLLLLLNPAVTVFDTFVRFIGINDFTDSVFRMIMDLMLGSAASSKFVDILDIIWIPLSIVLQMLVSFFMLKAASKALVRKPKSRKKKKY